MSRTSWEGEASEEKRQKGGSGEKCGSGKGGEEKRDH